MLNYFSLHYPVDISICYLRQLGNGELDEVVLLFSGDAFFSIVVKEVFSRITVLYIFSAWLGFSPTENTTPDFSA